MTEKATAATWIREELAAARLDGGLRASGFRRGATSLAFSRQVPDGKQKIHLDLLVRPRYAPDSFHLTLRATVHFPAMARIVVAMLGPHAVGFGKDGLVDNASLGEIVRNPPMFLFQTPGELRALAPDVERYVVDRMVPHLDERDSIEKLTALNLRRWEENRSSSDVAGRQPVVIAAGLLAAGDRDGAARTLETGYPDGSGERDQYRDAFAAVRG
jgi:hypothetical protein